MAEYIDREALLQDIEQSVVFSARTGTVSAEMRGARKIVDRIRNAPAADVAPVKHGKWIEVQKENIWNDIVPVLECSACGKYTVGTRGIMTKSNYCPNCGAKMGAEG